MTPKYAGSRFAVRYCDICQLPFQDNMHHMWFDNKRKEIEIVCSVCHRQMAAGEYHGTLRQPQTLAIDAPINGHDD